MVKLTHFFGAVALLSHAAVSTAAACSRPVLQTARDNFFKTLGSPTALSVKLLDSVKITQNNVLVKSLNDTIYGFKFSGWSKPLKLTVLDEETCNVAEFNVPTLNGKAHIISTRFKVTATGEIVELELFNGSDQIAFQSGLPDQRPAFWEGDAPAPRDQLFKVLDSYPTAIQAGDGSTVPVSPTCARYESGIKMPFTCNGLFSLFQAPVIAHRWYIDTKTGIGMGNFVFDNETKYAGMLASLWLHEYMKVKDGKIMEIYATMHSETKYKDPWSAPTLA